MLDLTGTTTLIVGGTSGIGLAAARLIGEYGGRTIVAGRSPDRLAEAIASLNSDRMSGDTIDAMDQVSVKNFFAKQSTFEHLIVTAGGSAAVGAFRDLDEDKWRLAFDAKFWAYVRVMQAALPLVQRSITLVTGSAARARVQGVVGLAATNGALEAMIPTLSRELAPLRVNNVSAGTTDTPLWDGLDPNVRQAMFDQQARVLSVGRVAQPVDIAEAVVLLATNGFTTGSILDCDGGAGFMPWSLPGV